MKGLNNKNLGSRFKKLREEVHMEQAVISKILGIPRTAVSDLEAGKRDVTVLEFVELCKIYRVSPNELLGWARTLPKDQP